ncbi:MAG: DUF192 domain-containing protein [Sphingomonas bacterium]|nr:DUF192 domain-containing protein [Sphingomonas bacterium]
MIVKLIFAALVAVPAACQPAASPVALERSPAGLDQLPLTIVSGSTTHRFTVEVARTIEQQQTGMMNRNSLAPDRGMLFPYDPPQPVAFWMKNTLIPLDLVFIAPGGKILGVEANAVPLSLDQLPSGGPIEAVLELAGGRAVELGLKSGDQVDWTR